jgi:hypothetical protein
MSIGASGLSDALFVFFYSSSTSLVEYVPSVLPLSDKNEEDTIGCIYPRLQGEAFRHAP